MGGSLGEGAGAARGGLSYCSRLVPPHAGHDTKKQVMEAFIRHFRNRTEHASTAAIITYLVTMLWVSQVMHCY